MVVPAAGVAVERFEQVMFRHKHLRFDAQVGPTGYGDLVPVEPCLERDPVPAVERAHHLDGLTLRVE